MSFVRLIRRNRIHSSTPFNFSTSIKHTFIVRTMAPKRTRSALTSSTADAKKEANHTFEPSTTRRKTSENGNATISPSKKGRNAEVEDTQVQANAAKGTKSPKKGNKEALIAEVEISANTSKETKSPKKNNAKSNEEEEEEEGEQNGKAESLSAPEPRSKTNYEAAEGLPRNMTIPDPLKLTPKPKGSSRIASWNIISLKSSMGKGLIRYIEAEDADVVFLSETKCNDVPMLPNLKERYPFQTWGIGKTKGYAGVALLSKIKPIKVTTGLPTGDQDTKARLITAEFENHILCGTYVVNAGEKLKSMPAKVQWNERFSAHLADCDKRKPTIWTGDLNVVLDARDLSKASEKWNKSAGYTATECDHHRRVLAGTAVEGAKPYVDIWRERHPDAIGHFTYFGFRGQCRQKGIGWRLDSFIIPERIKDSVVDVGIRHTVYGASDHLPIYMDIKGDL